MTNLKPIIAQNMSSLRTAAGMTQLELAEKLNYSDKAVSKWERGESVPDITVLKEIADLYGVTVDYLISEEHKEGAPEPKPALARKKRNRGFITGMSILLVWLIAAIAFVIIESVSGTSAFSFLPFLYAVPSTLIVWLILNSVWFNKRRNFLIISMLMWSALIGFYLTLYIFSLNIPLVFILGLPGQAIIFMWSKLNFS